MKIQIITEKPDQIEKELKLSVENLKKDYKPTFQQKLLFKMAHINADLFEQSMFAKYTKEDKYMFVYTVVFIGLDYIKPQFLKRLSDKLKKIDDKVIMNEI